MPSNPPSLAWSALALTLAGCLIPAPIDEQPEVLNLPPFIVSASPETNQVIRFDPALEDDVVVRVPEIGDPNLEDALYFQLFVNDRLEIFNVDGLGPFEPPFPIRVLPAPIEWTVKPCTDLANAARLGLDVHLIELLISDRPFDGRRTLRDGAWSDRVVWFLTFDIGDCG